MTKTVLVALGCTALLLVATSLRQAKPTASPTPAAPAAPPTSDPVLRWEGSVMCAVSVRDLKASQAWYADVLGCKVYYELLEAGWCELTTPVRGAFLSLSQKPEPEANGGSTFAIGVKDMDEALERLKAKGVKLDGEVVEIPETVKLLNFFDPDGNRLLFYQPWSGPPVREPK